MTDRPAKGAEEGIPSRPGEHLGLREARVSSHQAGVVEVRDRVDWGGEAKAGGDRGVPDPEEETATKWLLRILATEEELMLKQDQFSCEEEETPAALRVLHRAEG